MARGGGKRAARPSTATPPTSKLTVSSASDAGPPTPFQYAPPALRPFLSTLPTDHVWLVHLDRTLPALKKRVFAVPLLLNVIILAGLAVRVYFATPVYIQQIITIFGYDTVYKVDTATASASEIMSTLTSRTLLLMFDFALFGLLGSWPREFFFGSQPSRFAGVWQWRRTIGFRATEIIVRRGRKWDTPLLKSDVPGQIKTWRVDEELTLKVKVEPAMRPSYTAKSGLLLLDKDWDVDFKAMLDATRLVEKGAIQLADLENLVLVNYHKQWLVWHVRDAAQLGPKEKRSQDPVLDRFKDVLSDRGAEDVFFRWIEIIQYETSQPGGFTEGRQAEAIRELKQLLTARGVDYAVFWDDIGGQAGLPGFDRADQITTS